MWNFRYDHVHVDPITRSIGLTLLCSILAERLTARQTELCSEILGWLLLPLFTKTKGPSKIQGTLESNPIKNPETLPTSIVTLWLVASSVAGFCWFRAEFGLIGFFPVLTPLLLIVQKYCFRVEPHAIVGHDPSIFFACSSTIWVSAIVGLFAVGTLSNWDIRSNVLSIFPVAALLIAYIAVVSSNRRWTLNIPQPFYFEHEIKSLAIRVVAILVVVLGIETVVFGFLPADPMRTGTMGLVKALKLYSIVYAARYFSWHTITLTETFSIIATRDPFTQSSDLEAASHVVAILLVLSQIACIIPKRAKAKSALCLFFSLIALFPYAANMIAIRMVQSSLIHSQKHPVEDLILKSQVKFDALIQRQSKNLTGAADEYRRRYHVHPPPGFNDWYRFARSHQSPIMDDFDTIYQGISPFWRLSGRQVLDVVDQAQRAPGADLWLCVFSGREATTQCSHPFRKSDRDINHLFDSLLHQLPGVLPDVKFLVNHLDEPRVLIPPQPAESESAYHEQSNNRADFFNLSDISGKTTWDTLTEFCSSSSEHTGAYPDAHTETPSILPFISNLSSAIDLCRHPEYRSMHGLAISPTSFLPFQGPVPIFSTGAPSTMADILYPSPAYLQPEFRYNNNSAHDVSWARKRNQLYWMGSTTGGFAGPDTQWQHHHRQRFVQLAQNLDQKDHLYLREIDNHNGEATITSTHSSFLNSRLFDVAFTRITQCSPSSCRAQRQYFTTQSWADKDGALGSRLVFDLDGNGISGRYYKLLASRSTPLKQTIFREWHDDRLVPWVHYIPVSLGMEELPELVSYLTSTTAGQARAQEIAEQGRKWFFQALRDVDMTVYTYRLLLELARIQDPEREAWEIP